MTSFSLAGWGISPSSFFSDKTTENTGLHLCPGEREFNLAVGIVGTALEDENPRHSTWFTGSERSTCHATLPDRTSAFGLVHAFGVGIGPVTTELSIAAVLVAWLFFIPLGLMVEQEDTHSGSQDSHLNEWHLRDLVIGICHVSLHSWLNSYY